MTTRVQVSAGDGHHVIVKHKEHVQGQIVERHHTISPHGTYEFHIHGGMTAEIIEAEAHHERHKPEPHHGV
jgi:hypothetical protein